MAKCVITFEDIGDDFRMTMDMGEEGKGGKSTMAQLMGGYALYLLHKNDVAEDFQEYMQMVHNFEKKGE